MRKTKKLAAMAMVLGSVLFALLLGELAAALYFFRKDGALVPVVAKLEAERSKTYPGGTEACRWVDTIVPHPYLGHVYRSQGSACSSLEVSTLGFLGAEIPLTKRKGEFVVLVTGGSVAEQYAKSKRLERDLNAEYTGGEISRFIVLNGAIGAWKNPQPLLLAALYADLVDGIVTIDGFNEHPYYKGGALRFESPNHNSMVRRIDFGHPDWMRALGVRLDVAIHRWQLEHFIFRHSRLTYLIGSGLRGKIRNLVHTGFFNFAGDPDRGTPSDAFAIPFPRGTPREERVRYNQSRFLHLYRAMNGLAKQFSVKTLHFLQPVPALEKKLTPAEISVVGNLDYGEAYRTQVNAALGLRHEGLPMHSLLDVFKDIDESLYMDTIHVNQRGYDLLHSRILTSLVREWKLSAMQGRKLAAKPYFIE